MAEVANQNHDAGHGESRLPDRGRSCTDIALSPASLTVPVGWKRLIFFSLVVPSKNICPPGCWVQATASQFLVRRAMRWQRKQPSIVSVQMTLQPNKGPRDLAPLIVGSVRTCASLKTKMRIENLLHLLHPNLQPHRVRRLGPRSRKCLTKISSVQKRCSKTQ